MSIAPVRPSSRSPWFTEIRACLSLGWPLILTNAIEMAMNVTSLAMIGRIGHEALAASTIAQSFYNLFLLFGIGVTAAVAAQLAREVGGERDRGAPVRRLVHQGLWGAAFLTMPIWVVLWNAEPILVAVGQAPPLAAAAAGYLHALQWALLPALLYLVLRSFCAVMGHPRWAVVAGGVGIVLNAVLNWLLIGGHAGCPALGLFGSGLATLLSNVAMAAVLGLVAILHPGLRGFRIFADWLRPDWTGFAAFWRLGLPIGMSLLLETGMFTAATVFVGYFEVAALEAHAIALQVAALMFMIPLGLAQAATIRVGRAAGAGDGPAAIRAGWTALGLSLLAMSASATLLIAAPHLIIGLFLDPAEPGRAAVEASAVTLLALAGLFQIADGAQVALSGMLRGLQDTRVPMIIAAFGYWGVGIPVGAVLAFPLHMGAPGVWLGLTTGLFAVAGLGLVRWSGFLPQLRRRTLEPDPIWVWAHAATR